MLRQALADVPVSPTLHDRLGWAYLTLASVDAANEREHTMYALAHLQRAVALDPENPRQHESLARLVVAAWPHAPVEVGLIAARAAVQRNPGLVPETAVHRILLADTLETRGLKDAALGVHRKAVEIATGPEGAVARWLFGLTLLRRGDGAGALRELGAAAKLTPDNPEIYRATADALDATKDSAALEMYRVALARAEESERHGHKVDTAFRLIGPPLDRIVAGHLGKPVGAASTRYRLALARYLTSRGLNDAALREIATVVGEAPQDAETQFIRGLAHEGLGQREEALDAYATAVKLDDRTVGYRLRLARAYDQTGAKSEALQAYQVVLRIAPDSVEARRALTRFGWVGP
jgi:tetratricopeptide (TPR) repeat protein